MLLVSGCDQPTRVESGPNFCDVTYPRYFNEWEVQNRPDFAPENLRRDIAQNEFGRRNCPAEWLDKQ